MQARSSTKSTNRWGEAGLFLLALLPFVGTLSFGFVFDDTTIIRFNPDIRGWGAVWSVFAKPYWAANGAGATDLYRPVTTALFAILWNAGGAHAFWFHAYAIVAHAIATVLVYRLLRRATSNPASLVAGAWFAISPIHVEAVANVANSSEIVVTILALVLVTQALRSADHWSQGTSNMWPTALGCGFLYAAALLTKESAAFLPLLAVLMAVAWRPGNCVQADRRLANVADLGRRWWRFAVACTVAAAIVAVVRRMVLGGFVSGSSFAASGLDGLNALQRIWAMLALGPLIARLLIWPEVLNPFYGPTYLAGRTGPTLVALAFVVACTFSVGAALFMAKRGDRRLLAGLLWVPVAFLPASNLLVPTGQILAERTLYMASVGIALMIAVAIDRVHDAADRVAPLPKRAAATLWRCVCAIGIIAAVLVTSARSHVWGNHQRLFQQMITADPAGHRGYWLLGMAMRAEGRDSAALALLDHAYRLYPHERQLRIDYAETLMADRQPRKAAVVAAGLMDWPELRTAPGAISLYLNAVGQGFGADSLIVAGERLWHLQPSSTAALYLGNAYAAIGNQPAARKAFAAGAQLTSKVPAAAVEAHLR